MEHGWIKLHRKMLENPMIQKSNYLALWITLLLKANHKENKMIWNNDTIVIHEGQLITGRKQLSKETGIAETTIERVLDYLEKTQQIGQQKTTKFRLITILNWKSYQTADNKRTTNGQQTDTNKKLENDKNREREESGISLLKNPTPELIAEMTSRFKATEIQVKSKIASLVDYCEAKGKRYKNYKSFLSNALRKDYGERPEKTKIPIYDSSSGIAKLVGYK